jgi:hypothetical protein
VIGEKGLKQLFLTRETFKMPTVIYESLCLDKMHILCKYVDAGERGVGGGGQDGGGGVRHQQVLHPP